MATNAFLTTLTFICFLNEYIPSLKKKKVYRLIVYKIMNFELNCKFDPKFEPNKFNSQFEIMLLYSFKCVVYQTRMRVT